MSKKGNVPVKVFAGKIVNGQPSQVVDVTDQFINQSGVPQFVPKDIEVITPKTIKQSQPAVLFDNYNVYTTRGYVEVPSTIYNTIVQINSGIVENTFESLTKENSEFCIETLKTASISNLVAVIDSFAVTLRNIYDVFIANMRNDVMVSGSTVEGFEPQLSAMEIENLNNTLLVFLNANQSLRTDILKNYLADYLISFINGFGIRAYNNARFQLNQFIIRVNFENEQDVVEKFTKFDSYFSRMMADMSYETSVLIKNFEIILPYTINLGPGNLYLQDDEE